MSNSNYTSWKADADGATTPIAQYTYMDLASTGKLTAATNAVKGFGVIQDYVDKDDYTVSVRVQGETFAIASAAIAIGAELEIISGKMVTKTAGVAVAKALEAAAADGDIIKVMLYG